MSARLDRRGSSDRPGERVEFRFSGFRAVQVPVVSDRLILSIVAVDTGKTIAKSTKAAALSGICQWPDSILEPIWFSQDEVSKEFHDCQCRFVVSMGSTENGILGEVLLNMTNYLSSLDSNAISLPLEKCNSGTTLQLNIQCLGTNSKTSTTDRINVTPRDNSNDELYIRRHASVSPVSIHISAGHSDEVTRSNNSSFSSRTPAQNMLQGINAQPFARDLSQLSSGASDVSKDILNNAEEAIDELRGEAKMWERKSRKLKRGLETLKKESADKSKKQSELALELAASNSERDALRQEIEELKCSLEQATEHQIISGSPRSGDVIELHKEVKDDIQFLKESNVNLSTQLKKTQDANIELVSILQELEETIEVQRVEISNISRASNLIDHEASKNDILIQENVEWARELSLKEDEIAMLREKLHRMLNVENPNNEGSDVIYLELEKENDFLKVKIQELEKDCSELTDENMELIYKLKEVSGIARGDDLCVPNNEEVANEGDLFDSSTSKVKYLETKCADLELKLNSCRSESSELEEKLQKSQDELKDRTLELSDLRDKLSGFHATEMEEGDTGSAKSYKSRTEKLDENNNETELDALRSTVVLKEQEIESLQHSKKEMENFLSEIENEKNKLEERLEAALKECSITSTCLNEVREELLVLTSSVDSHVSTNNVLETKISELEIYKVSLELHISKLEQENIEQLKECSITSACLNEVREELLVLTSSVDSHVSTNNVLETKISELEIYKGSLELHISKLEQENIELSDSICGIEAQLNYLTSEMELSMLQLDESRSLITDLNDNLIQQQAEVEAQKVELKKNQLESDRRLSEVQEDSETLRRSNAKLQSTVDRAVEECKSLQTLTADLKKQKLEVHGYAAHLEQELEQSKRKTMDFCKTLEFLDAKLSSLQKDISFKEQSLLSELENIFQEHKEHEERIKHAHFLLNKIEKEKIVELSNLEREVVSLTAQVSSTQEERENSTLDTIREVSILRADKAKLEANLEDVNAQMIHYKSQLEDLQESKAKIKGLVDSLNASKQNEEMLATDVDHMRRSIEDARSNENDLRKTLCELELKFKSSDYEKHQIIEEISGLKIQVCKISALQDEILTLQNSLDKAKFEKGKLEGLLQSLSEECEELKSQKGISTDKVACLQDTLNVANEEKQSEISKQTKPVMLDDDTPANETSHVLEAELKSELSIIKGANSEYQQKIHSLEKENEDLMRRSQLMEKELELKTNQNKHENINKQGNDANENGDSPVNDVPELQSKIQLLETRLAEALEESKLYRGQLKSPIPEGNSTNKDVKENDNDKISQLESELKDMQERLLNMSMQYAEVEAQREELVMELKTANARKGRWF
uniref:C2 NT-type domain-containing protein n=1 Tax=Oryza brachyantha TaxID=4533 RepID=J3N4M6_ORYBR